MSGIYLGEGGGLIGKRYICGFKKKWCGWGGWGKGLKSPIRSSFWTFEYIVEPYPSSASTASLFLTNDLSSTYILSAQYRLFGTDSDSGGRWKTIGRGCSKTSLISCGILTISLTYFWRAVAQYRITFCSCTDSDCGRRLESLTRITGFGWVTRRLPRRICQGHSLKYFRKSPRCNRLLVNSEGVWFQVLNRL